MEGKKKAQEGTLLLFRNNYLVMLLHMRQLQVPFADRHSSAAET
jgi:hypothetical protein